MRLIDADRLLPKLKKFHNMINPRLIGGKAVRELTLIIIKYFEDEHYKIDPESLRPKAKWEERQSWTSVLYCSNCEHEENWSTKYCPNCGAKMDLEVRQMKKLSEYSTRELVEELEKREGVDKKIAEPYKDCEISVNGPAVILIVTD